MHSQNTNLIQISSIVHIIIITYSICHWKKKIISTEKKAIKETCFKGKYNNGNWMIEWMNQINLNNT